MALLHCTNIGKHYRMGDSTVSVLKGVDLTVAEGEFLAVEGRSGSGKSTLLHIMGALESPDMGEVTFAGKTLSSLPANERSRLRNSAFGFVFQFYHLLPELNVMENTMLAPMIEHSWFAFRSRRNDLRERATALLKSFGLERRLHHRPSQLSGGERQRVAIARALMNRPRILFADEPTGNLDQETGQQIMSVLEALHRDQKQTIIMVTHDRALARTADRVLILKNGKLAVERPV